MSGITLAFWHWLILAGILFAIEAVAPGIYLIWFGVAAAVVGLLLFLGADMAAGTQLVVFAIVSVISVIVGRRIYLRARSSEPDSLLNQRAAQYVGRTVVLSTAIEGGNGRASVEDTEWLVTGPELPKGTQVRVTGEDQGRLTVEPLATP